jgi:hypothetical protein
VWLRKPATPANSLLLRTSRASVKRLCGDACFHWSEAGAPATLPLGSVAQSRSPALADIIGARRARTAAMISSGSMP